MIRKLLMYLIYGALIGIPAGLISSIILIPMYLLMSGGGMGYLAVIGMGVGFIVLGWWARHVIRNIHLLGG